MSVRPDLLPFPAAGELRHQAPHTRPTPRPHGRPGGSAHCPNAPCRLHGGPGHMTSRICAHPGCGRIIAATIRRCPQHAAAHQQAHAQRPVNLIYRDPRWRTTRRLVLERDDYTCQLCGNPATTADHHPTPALQCADPYDPDTCRALCASCSGRSDGGRRGTQGGEPITAPPALNPWVTHREKNRVEPGSVMSSSVRPSWGG